MTFHDEMQFHRPAWPEVVDAGPARDGLRRQHRHEMLVWWATCAGRRIVGRVGDALNEELETLFNTADPDSDAWPRYFCAECYAGCSPEFGPQRGLDSHSECAEDGEAVYWTVSLTPGEVWLHRVFNILVDTCGAPEGIRADFLYHFPECREFRFMGDLGSGGKVWAEEPLRVSCYAGDRTPARVEMIARAEQRLDSLVRPSA